jgi:hypothetical protein
VKYESTYERLLANSIIPEGQSELAGCWIWQGSVDRKGYGRLALRIKNKKNPTGVRAHREMLRLFEDEDFVPDPDLHTVEHLCFVTGCINPDHMVWLTRVANTSSMRARSKKS